MDAINWSQRARGFLETAPPPADETDRTRVSSVLSAEGGRVFRKTRASGIAPDESEAWLVEVKATPPASVPTDTTAVAWTAADIARFLDRRARLLRWGWAESEAERLAERLVHRDREHDDRVSCTDCQHYRPGRCGNHRRAGLASPTVGPDLAATPQHCPGYAAAPGAPAGTRANAVPARSPRHD